MPRSAFTRAFPETICRDFGQQTTDGFCKNAAREPLVTFLSRNEILFLRNSASPTRSLPVPALCLSRFDMDALLAERFRELGGELREKERWRENGAGEGTVRANGRRLQPTENGWRWFGLKIHARNVSS